MEYYKSCIQVVSEPKDDNAGPAVTVYLEFTRAAKALLFSEDAAASGL